MKPLEELVRPEILKIAGERCGRAGARCRRNTVCLDANENPYAAPFNRYSYEAQDELKAAVARYRGVAAANVCLGSGCRELADILFRCFCEPGRDNVVAIEPTYHVYRQMARLNGVGYRAVPLDGRFQMTAADMLAGCDDHTKLIWICSPNNPTGNRIDRDEIEKLLGEFQGIVVVDEAYADFAKKGSFRAEAMRRSNLVVLDTMSTSIGGAALRIVMLYADEATVGLLGCFDTAEGISVPAVRAALEKLGDVFEMEKQVNMIVAERQRMMASFAILPMCGKVYSSDANFFLVKMRDAREVAERLENEGIAVGTVCCDDGEDGMLRITVGTKTENNALLAALRDM